LQYLHILTILKRIIMLWGIKTMLKALKIMLKGFKMNWTKIGTHNKWRKTNEK